MTRVKLTCRDGELEAVLRGHAGDEKVCAAASMLVCALMERLEQMRPRFAELHLSSGEGRADVYARADGETAVLLREDAELLLCGFELLRAAFPSKITTEGSLIE